jgi:hypothetical protein
MTKQQDSRILLGMIMLKDDKSFDVSSFVEDFETRYSYNIHEPTGDNGSFVFHADEEMAAIAHMSIPIPSGDIEETAQYAYNWQTALEDTNEHKSHLIVSILQGGQDQIKRFKLFTQILCSLLRTTKSIGVYKGNQSLLIPKEDYLSEAELMDEDYLPLNLWVYFGLRVTGKGNSGYTYGLKEFNKDELEVVDSSKDLEDIRGFLFNTAHYVLEYDVTFADGQTIGSCEEEKILISFSKGQLVEGNTFKFAY